MSHLKVEASGICSDAPSGIFVKIFVFNWNRSIGFMKGNNSWEKNKFQLLRITDIFTDMENISYRDFENISLSTCIPTDHHPFTRESNSALY